MENILPKNWVETELDSLFSLAYGKGLSVKELLPDGKYNVYGANGIIGKYNSFNQEKSKVIISCRGAASGAIHQTKPKSFVTSNSIVLDSFSDELILPNYVKYFMSSADKSDVITGTAQPQITIQLLKNLNFCFPPLAEQQRIVNKLDTIFKHLDALKTRLDNIPKLLKNFRQAILTQAVTGELTEEWRVGKELEDVDLYLKSITEDLDQAYKLKCEEAKKDGLRKPKDQRKNKKSDKGDVNLDILPEEWRYRRTEDLSYLVTDGVHFKPTYIEKGIPFLSVKNVRPFVALEESCKYISEEHHLEYVKRCNPENGDILYTKVGATYGYAAKVDFDFDFSIYVSLALIKPSKLLNSDYLELLFNSPLVFNQARHRVSGSGVPDLHLIEIRDFKLPIPPLAEQTEIVKRVEHLFAKADTIEAQYQSLKTKIDSLPQAILAKAFKGELVEQLESDGSAAMLLEEIQKMKASLRGTKQSQRKKKKN